MSKHECDMCEGEGEITLECTECDGKGYLEYEGDDEEPTVTKAELEALGQDPLFPKAGTR